MTTWQYSTRSVKRRDRNERIAAATYGMSTVMGHMHARCSIEYSQTPVKTYWQAFTGCYADDTSLAMRYSSESARKSVPAFLFIEDGQPRIIRVI